MNPSSSIFVYSHLPYCLLQCGNATIFILNFLFPFYLISINQPPFQWFHTRQWNMPIVLVCSLGINVAEWEWSFNPFYLSVDASCYLQVYISWNTKTISVRVIYELICLANLPKHLHNRPRKAPYKATRASTFHGKNFLETPSPVWFRHLNMIPHTTED